MIKDYKRVTDKYNRGEKISDNENRRAGSIWVAAQINKLNSAMHGHPSPYLYIKKDV